jgi:hypothetical protein
VAAGLTASSASPTNVLGTLALAPASGLAATANAGGSVTLGWIASPSSQQRPVEYVVLRRVSATGPFAEVARIGPLGYTDVMCVDAPPAGTYDYAVRTVVSTFTSADTAPVTVTTTP